MLRQIPLVMILLGLALSVSGCVSVQPGACGSLACGSPDRGLASDQGCAVSACGSGHCDGQFAGWEPLAGLLGSGCCGLGGCGQWYVDEWLNEPPVPDNCGLDACGSEACCSDACSGGCGAPVRSFFRWLVGDRYMANCESCSCDQANCSADCDSGCPAGGDDCSSSDTGCPCGSGGVGTTTSDVLVEPTDSYSTPVPSAPTTKPTSKTNSPTPAPVLKSSAATRLNPAMRKVVR